MELLDNFPNLRLSDYKAEKWSRFAMVGKRPFWGWHDLSNEMKTVQRASKAELENLAKSIIDEISIGSIFPGKDMRQNLAEIVNNWFIDIKPGLGVEEPMASASELFKEEVSKLGINGRVVTFVRDGTTSLWVVFKTEPEYNVEMNIAKAFRKVFSNKICREARSIKHKQDII